MATVPAAPIGTGPAPEDVRPGEETLVEVDGLLITTLPGGELALVDSHPDGATSVINLDRRRLDALVPFLREKGSGEGPVKESARGSEEGSEKESVRGSEEGSTEGPDGGNEVDWELYDEQLKAAFLLEQYARGVAPEELPVGWDAILKALPAALTRRSRRTRTSNGAGAEEPASDVPFGKE